MLGGCSQKINALLEVAKSQSKAQNQLEAETKYFNNLKTAVEEGRIKSGFSKAHIKRTIGPPVIIQDEDYGQRWVYKPADATFFDNNKIYLYFNEEGLLTKYKVFEPEDSD
jgi:hypothetical protein